MALYYVVCMLYCGVYSAGWSFSISGSMYTVSSYVVLQCQWWEVRSKGHMQPSLDWHIHLEMYGELFIRYYCVLALTKAPHTRGNFVACNNVATCMMQCCVVVRCRQLLLTFRLKFYFVAGNCFQQQCCLVYGGLNSYLPCCSLLRCLQFPLYVA